MMMPAYMRMVQPAQAAAAAGSDAEGSDGTPSKKKRTKITTASVPLNKLPKCHLLDAVEMVSDKSLDATLTGHCEEDELCIILWLMTKIQPSMKTPDLRCEYYDELSAMFKKAADRVSEEDPAAWKFMVQKISTFLSNHQVAQILQYALELGFDPEWLGAKGKKPKREKASKRMESMLNNATKVANGEEVPQDEICESLVSQLNYFI